jgi:hypothetical protein
MDRDSQHLASEKEAARSEAEIIKEIVANYESYDEGADTEVPLSDHQNYTDEGIEGGVAECRGGVGRGALVDLSR